MAKLLLLSFNYCQYNKAQCKNLRAFLKLLGPIIGHLFLSFIDLFIYLFFRANKFLLTIVITIVNFYNLSLLKFFWHTEAVPQRCFPGKAWSTGVLRIFRDVSVHGCDFKGYKGALFRSRFCIVVLLWVYFILEEHLSRRTPTKDCFWTKIISYIIFRLFFLINYIFEDVKVSLLF